MEWESYCVQNGRPESSRCKGNQIGWWQLSWQRKAASSTLYQPMPAAGVHGGRQRRIQGRTGSHDPQHPRRRRSSNWRWPEWTRWRGSRRIRGMSWKLGLRNQEWRGRENPGDGSRIGRVAGKHRVTEKRGAQSNIQEWKRCNTPRLPPSEKKRSSHSDGHKSNTKRGNNIPAPTTSRGCQKEEKDAYQTKSKGRENQNLVAGWEEEGGVCRGSQAGNGGFQSGNGGIVLKDTVLKAATSKCGRTTGKAKKDKDTWWWCEETQKAIQKTKTAFKKWQEVKTEEAKERYKEAKKEARRAVAKARSETTEEWYQALDTKEGEKAIYKVARARQRARQDVGDLMVIEDEEGRILVSEKLVRLIKCMYEGATTKVRTPHGDSDSFWIGVGAHQGSVLGPLLFKVASDTISEECRKGLPGEALYAYNLSLATESQKQLGKSAKKWQTALENKGLKMNAEKTEVMVSSRPASKAKLKIIEEHGARLQQNNHKYLGDVTEETGGCEMAVRVRVKAACQKWRDLSAVLRDARLLVKLKFKI